MTALTLCVSAAQKEASVRVRMARQARRKRETCCDCGGSARLEMEERGESATAASAVLTDLALLEQGHQSLTVHLGQTQTASPGKYRKERRRTPRAWRRREKKERQRANSRAAGTTLRGEENLRRRLQKFRPLIRVIAYRAS